MTKISGNILNSTGHIYFLSWLIVANLYVRPKIYGLLNKQMHQHLVKLLGADTADINLVDGFLMDVCVTTYDLLHNVDGLLIGDKGYIKPSLKSDCHSYGIDLQTPLRKNMIDSRPKWFVRQLMKIRRRIETVIVTAQNLVVKMHFLKKLF